MEINDKLNQLNHELKMNHEMELKEMERKHELDMLKLRGGCLGKIFGCN